MNQFRLTSSKNLLSREHGIFISADINHALIEYGLIVKSNYLQWLIYGEDPHPSKMNDLVLNMSDQLLEQNKIDAKLTEQLHRKTQKYLYDLPTRRRMALSFVLFNSVDFNKAMNELIDHDFSEKDKKRIVGREVEKEIYVTGSYNLENKILEYLTLEATLFVEEYKGLFRKISRDRIIELIDVHSKTSIAQFSCSIVE
ncbi:hypothetical protein [Alkalitalea saponilacus]|uniref:Uncharacterized protein n=1 Tax=Alkalitalea saponilacus TaxID=889453 RepID=A0A1T5F8I3_9BACT|nr:hypothetical protein [Alkalitalea saponilacus]ASB50137.1 hypothetical protein CDL62_13810 [Alkalitalea saponilacus]SKB92434.1 hypothetical protein SAMN03080601_01519 [Alkalitalea saponilacus]